MWEIRQENQEFSWLGSKRFAFFFVAYFPSCIRVAWSFRIRYYNETGWRMRSTHKSEQEVGKEKKKQQTYQI